MSNSSFSAKQPPGNECPDERPLRCPVCRARQTLRDECRRCHADLSLVVRALRRVDLLVARRETAIADRDGVQLQVVEAELKLLSPAAWSARG